LMRLVYDHRTVRSGRAERDRMGVSLIRQMVGPAMAFALVIGLRSRTLHLDPVFPQRTAIWRGVPPRTGRLARAGAPRNPDRPRDAACQKKQGRRGRLALPLSRLASQQPTV